MITRFLRQVLPVRMTDYLRRQKRSRRRASILALPPLTPEKFRRILTDDLGLSPGEVVFVHSSIDRLHLTFPFQQLLKILQETVGERGTLLFPTYPKLSSYEFLARGEIFDVRNTPAFTGILTELARRQRSAVRSIHPTKSVCALGPLALELTRDHGRSPRPYDHCSPYFQLVPANGKIIGIGVQTTNLSFVHCVDDFLKDKFPVAPYHDRLFQAKCIDYEGQTVIIETYAHDMLKMVFDIPRFMRNYIPREICQDLDIDGMPFFRGQARSLFERMVALAQDNITIYAKKFYKSRI
jgi:aminoglycoside 3-N-acetyltransferase